MLQSNPVAQSATTPTVRTRLNLFQRLVRQWERVHPYNGVQAIRVRGRVDLKDCRRAWQETLDSLGLGRVCLSGDQYHYVCLNGEADEHAVELCPPGACLDRWISEELNRPFDSTSCVPFRPVLIHEADSSWMGLAYQHWVADSASIRRLMRDWFARLFDPGVVNPRSVRGDGAGYLRLFGPHRACCWRGGGALLAYIRWQRQFRRVQRIENPEKFARMNSQFIHQTGSDGLIDRLGMAARQAGATVNDLFLAAIARVCRRWVPTHIRSKRRNLAIGSIVDLRPKSGQSMEDVFNLLLGFTSVACSPEDLEDWPRLVGTISRQTRAQKANSIAESSWIRILGGLAAARWLDEKTNVEMYRKRVALTGACSNVNLNRDWPAKYFSDPLQEYVRVAPTGPMTPLVFTPTTLGNTLGIGLTYRQSILPDDRAAEALGMFIDELERIAMGKKPTDGDPSALGAGNGAK
jgi:hypothetical protein